MRGNGIPGDIDIDAKLADFERDGFVVLENVVRRQCRSDHVTRS